MLQNKYGDRATLSGILITNVHYRFVNATISKYLAKDITTTSRFQAGGAWSTGFDLVNFKDLEIRN